MEAITLFRQAPRIDGLPLQKIIITKATALRTICPEHSEDVSLLVGQGGFQRPNNHPDIPAICAQQNIAGFAKI